MLGIIGAAGVGARAREVQEKYDVAAKCLLPINERGNKTIIDMAVLELSSRCDAVMIVCNAQSKQVIDDRFKSWPKVYIVDQEEFPAKHSGTSQAVMAGLTASLEWGEGINKQFGSVLIAWSDMLFKIPHIPTIPANMIFTTAVSQSKSDRFDAVACSGSTVLAISPRGIPKQGPFLMTTGVYLLRDIKEFVSTYNMLIKNEDWQRSTELPVETIFLNMISRGFPFQADALDFYLDLGTDEEFTAYARRFL